MLDNGHLDKQTMTQGGEMANAAVSKAVQLKVRLLPLRLRVLVGQMVEQPSWAFSAHVGSGIASGPPTRI